jgi:hypothetical protein
LTILFKQEFPVDTISKATFLAKTTAGVLIAILTILEDVKCVLDYATAKEAFANLSTGIAIQIKNGKRFDQMDVAKWMELLQLVRSNIRCIGIIQTPNQIFVFIQTMVILTGLLFISFKMIIASSIHHTFYLGVLIGFTFCHRLLYKIIAAQHLVEEVN